MMLYRTWKPVLFDELLVSFRPSPLVSTYGTRRTWPVTWPAAADDRSTAALALSFPGDLKLLVGNVVPVIFIGHYFRGRRKQHRSALRELVGTWRRLFPDHDIRCASLVRS